MGRLSGENKNVRARWGSFTIGGPRHEYRESLLLEWVKKDLKKGSVVLDAGCGSGSLLFKLAEMGYRVCGLELSEEYIKSIDQKVRSMGIDNVLDVRRGSIENIPYRSNLFDLIVSGEVLEHVADDMRAIREFFRVLKPGGLCIVSVPADPELWDFTDEWAGHLRRYTRKELVTLFEDKGFIVKDTKFWGFPLVRLYHRYVYLPYMKKKDLGETPPDEESHKVISKVLSTIFRFDSLFTWAPFGIGLILKAQKPSTTIDLKLNMGLNILGCPS